MTTSRSEVERPYKERVLKHYGYAKARLLPNDGGWVIDAFDGFKTIEVGFAVSASRAWADASDRIERARTPESSRQESSVG